MKRSVIIISIFLLILLLAGRTLLKTGQELDNEMEEYIHNLNYVFAAKIDSIVLLNSEKDLGLIVCRITDGSYNKFVEDSLNQHLVNYKRIRFLSFNQNGQILKYMANVSKYKPNDSIRINSNEDKYYIFRDRKVIFERAMSESTVHKVYFAFWLHD
jgi:hypothetical protein